MNQQTKSNKSEMNDRFQFLIGSRKLILGSSSGLLSLTCNILSSFSSLGKPHPLAKVSNRDQIIHIYMPLANHTILAQHCTDDDINAKQILIASLSNQGYFSIRSVQSFFIL